MPTSRLKQAQEALAKAELKVRRIACMQAEAADTRLPRGVPKPSEGEIDAVVQFGTYVRDDAYGEEGFAIGFRAEGISTTGVTMLANVEPDEFGPDLAPGDMVRLHRIGNRRHHLVRVIRRATVRKRIDWMKSWHNSAIPNAQLARA